MALSHELNPLYHSHTARSCNFARSAILAQCARFRGKILSESEHNVIKILINNFNVSVKVTKVQDLRDSSTFFGVVNWSGCWAWERSTRSSETTSGDESAAVSREDHAKGCSRCTSHRVDQRDHPHPRLAPRRVSMPIHFSRKCIIKFINSNYLDI